MLQKTQWDLFFNPIMIKMDYIPVFPQYHTIFSSTKCIPFRTFACSTNLFAIVSDWWQNGSQCLETHCNIQQMSSKEEVVVVPKDRHSRVPR